MSNQRTATSNQVIAETTPFNLALSHFIKLKFTRKEAWAWYAAAVTEESGLVQPISETFIPNTKRVSP